MREVIFRQPVMVGDIVSCYAHVERVGRTSITVTVRVVAHRPAEPKAAVEVTQAQVVYVNVDEPQPTDSGAEVRPVPSTESSKVDAFKAHEAKSPLTSRLSTAAFPSNDKG